MTEGTFFNDVEEHRNDSGIVSVCHRKRIQCKGKKMEHKWADSAVGGRSQADPFPPRIYHRAAVSLYLRHQAAGGEPQGCGSAL